MQNKKILFRQLSDLETNTFTYLLAELESKEAILIDSVKTNHERDLRLIKELDLKLVYILETHIHADHITGAFELSEATGAKRVVPFGSHVPCADILIKDSEKLYIGKTEIKAIATPGHTDSCTSYLVENMLFTGDALFIRGTGRTDFQNGSAKELYKSINEKIFNLKDDTYIYPGHDYNGMSVSTIREEKSFNPRIKLGTTEKQFLETMASLKLANPKKIHEAVPANLKCGREEEKANAI
jgi:sulfur dioxygenase